MPPSSSPTVRAAFAALEAMGGMVEARPGPDPDVEITGVAPDREAGPGDLGWLSPDALAGAPDRASGFRGTLLVVPEGTRPLPSCAVAVVEAPRLAFSRLVAALFPDRLRSPWPSATLASGADVSGDARLSTGVVVGEGAVIGPGVEVGPNTVLAHCTLGRGVRVGPNCTIGTDGFGYTRDEDGVLVPFPHLGRVAIEEDVVIGANTCIDRGALGETRVGARTRIDNLVHIAHNVRIGADCAVIAHAMIAGGVVIGDGAWVAPSAAVLNQRSVGAGAVVGLGAVVIRDVALGQTVAGNPARPL